MDILQFERARSPLSNLNSRKLTHQRVHNDMTTIAIIESVNKIKLQPLEVWLNQSETKLFVHILAKYTYTTLHSLSGTEGSSICSGVQAPVILTLTAALVKGTLDFSPLVSLE